MSNPIAVLCLLLTTGTLAVLGGDMDKYGRENGTFTNNPDATISGVSDTACAISCTSMEPWFCGGFTFRNSGTCDLYRGIKEVTCVNPEETAPSLEVDTGSEPRSYRRLQPSASPCPVGGGWPETEGQITSPSYPEPYPHSTDIFWILVAEPGQTIRVDITDFAMEEDDVMCRYYDYLEFRDGDSLDAPSLGRFCGTNYESEIGPTSGNVLTIVMHTDDQDRDRGFNITWKACDSDDGLDACGSTNISGTVQSVNYPEDYPDLSTAYWHLKAAHPSRTFSLTFLDFSIEEEDGCEYDTLKIAEDGVTLRGPLCGTNTPEPYGPSAGPRVSINMLSDNSEAERGFSSRWTAICNGSG